MIISISGVPGSGKSTIGRILEKKLGYKRYYIGQIRREKAKEKEMTLEEYNKLGEKDFSTDQEVDQYQKKLGQVENNFVIEGRTSFYFIPKSKKIYLDVDLEEGVRRINQRQKSKKEKQPGEEVSTLKKTLESVKKRLESDKKRYKQYYGFDYTDKKHYDLVINTTNKKPEEIVGEILSFLKITN